MWNKETKNADYNPTQNFDQEISVTKAGKKIVWKDFIEAANEDVEPYKVFEKYGSLEKIKIDVETVHGDFEELNDLRKNLDREIKAKEMWDNLPWEVRKRFGNDINTFRDEGPAWIKKQHDEILAKKAAEEKERLKYEAIAKAEAEKAAQAEITNTGVTNNAK